MEQTVALIDLFGKDFIIPHYQRGYRWEAQEVEELLDDLWNFEKTSNKGEFYCLQPLVLRQEGDNLYHVLDGQQRLTTLYLIITYLEDIRKDAGYNQPLFKLDYETRKGCQKFLEEKSFTNGIDENNIDYYHICKAYETIKNWFANPKYPGARMKLVPVLMDKNDKGNRNVRFIWYEAENNTNPIDIFIRLNVGKIPLTDAELSKALLLQSDKYDEKEFQFVERHLFELASEWDTVEYALQNDEFWYFLNNSSNQKPTHIEFIFDLIADKLQKEKKYFTSKPIKHPTFLILSEYLQDLMENQKLPRIKAVEIIWEQVIEYYEYFREWYKNRKLYHHIGYLISQKGNQIIDSLILQSKVLSKKQFVGYLESEIGKTIVIRKKRIDTDGNEYKVKLDNLNYQNEDQKTNDIPEIHRILLLHNVHTSLNCDKENARFPFNLYKQTKRKEKWSLEHIHAQNSESITKKENQITWLNDHIQSLNNQNNPAFEDLIKRMKILKEMDEIEQETFDKIVADVYNSVKDASDFDEAKTHNISNLCLIDANTNSLLNNSVFDVKREKIKEKELKGHYIPICTRNVFLKAYSKFPPNNAYWTNNDRKFYLKSIKSTYDFFVKSIKNN